jgi:hypothetical protein
MNNSRTSLPSRVCCCLAENTLVDMADGSKRPIQDVRIGEMLLNNKGEAATVINAITGCEQMVYCLKLANEVTLKATGRHPVLTQNGWKAMQDLTGQDLVRTLAQGGQAVASILTEEYNGTVYTLELDSEDHTMVCNSIIVGDFFLESRRQGR